MKRTIRRTALLHFPAVSGSREYVERVKEEGFTDIGLGLIPDNRVFTGQGYRWDRVCRMAEWIEEFGLGLVLFTGYMKYREDFLQKHPERSMVCIGGSGAALDSDNLVRSKWLCPFQPENKAEYLDLLNRVIQLPPLREIHLNDEASIGFSNGSIGCYCPHCLSEFEGEFGYPPPTSPDWESEKWWIWVQYRMENWTAVHAYFRDRIRQVRPDMAVGIQYSSNVTTFVDNPWRPGIDLSRDAEALDVLCTDPYHHSGSPRFPYHPLRRVLVEASRTLAGATIKRAMNIYPQAFMPPLSSLDLTHRDGFMAGAIPFAVGAENITPYTYDLMQLIPGFYEGMQEAKALIPCFEKTQPYSFATVLNPSQTEIYGYPEEQWGHKVLTRWPDVMNQVGLPWRWIFDRRLSDAADELSGPIVLPDAHCLTREQREILHAHADSGHGLLRVGRTPAADWPGHGACPPPAGETSDTAELKPIYPGHPLLKDVALPIMIASAFSEPGIEGETVAEVDGRPGLIVKEDGERREAWLAGIPIFGYIRPGDHGSHRTPTGGVALLRNLLCWLARAEPTARLRPYPPENAYRDLRPWDRREVPTMELFPMLGDDCLVCLIFNYVGLAYRTNLEMRLPEGATAASLVDIPSGEDLMSPAERTGREISLPIEMPAEQEWLAVELRWE